MNKLLSEPAITPYPLTLVLATVLGYHGYRSGSLCHSGAICASVLGYTTLANPIRTFGVALLTFYFVGSKITKVCDLCLSNLGLSAFPRTFGESMRGEGSCRAKATESEPGMIR